MGNFRYLRGKDAQHLLSLGPAELQAGWQCTNDQVKKEVSFFYNHTTVNIIYSFIECYNFLAVT